MAMSEAERGGDWVETFKAWVWEPPFERMRVRGLSNASLFIRPGRFTVEARQVYRRIGGWEEAEYDWSVVVVETLRPLGSAGLLFEMSRKLARRSVQFQGARLRRALTRAGFVVVEYRHWGWEAPRRVPTDVLGEHARDVPAAGRSAAQVTWLRAAATLGGMCALASAWLHRRSTGVDNR
jgi:hypothetical protein